MDSRICVQKISSESEDFTSETEYSPFDVVCHIPLPSKLVHFVCKES